jgi:hypothetical protein
MFPLSVSTACLTPHFAILRLRPSPSRLPRWPPGGTKILDFDGTVRRETLGVELVVRVIRLPGRS